MGKKHAIFGAGVNHCKNPLLHHKRLIFNTIEIATLRCPATKTTFNGPDVKCTPLKGINQRDFPFIQHMIGIQSSPLTKWFYPSHKGSSTIKKSQRWLLVLGCCLSLINNKGPLVVPPATLWESENAGPSSNTLACFVSWQASSAVQHPGHGRARVNRGRLLKIGNGLEITVTGMISTYFKQFMKKTI